MTEPFARVPKKLPKVYFNDGEVIYSSWLDPEVSTPEGRHRFVVGIREAMRAFTESQKPKRKKARGGQL